MNPVRISVQNVAKRFRRGPSADSLYSLVANRLAHPFSHRGRRRAAEFMALEDVSLAVRAGECVGVIGHNGAGKSTLLKLLAGIMRPDHGSIEVFGRVSALIEVGAGFHPALTGRENIFLNASILGMTRAEATAQFDAIVEFAGVGRHIDAPVKHYSSGMHARLGFAIAVHARPDVLLVDEVLSVGDRTFRARCLERMHAFLRRGVAIVFVSHDLATVQRFCHRVIVLSQGRPVFEGSPGEAVAQYHRSHAQTLLLRDEAGNPLARYEELRLCNASGRPVRQARPGERLRLEYVLTVQSRLDQPSFGLSIMRLSDRSVVYETSSTRCEQTMPPIEAFERRLVRCEFAMNVSPGEYTIGIHVRDRDSLRYLIEEVDLVRVTVNGAGLEGGAAYLAPTYPFIDDDVADGPSDPRAVDVLDSLESAAAGSPSR